ncbi:MAG: hypothetical protein ACLGH8_14685 [Bacteroidia bacterium]
MDYAATHHNRGRQPRGKTTTSLIPKARGIHGRHETPQRCSSGKEGHPATCSGNPTADGFLRTVFPATLKENKTLRDSTEKEHITAGFCASFSQLTAHYGITLPLPETFRYPDTIAYYFPLLRDALKDKAEGFYSLRLVNGDKKTFLVTEQHYPTGQTLYYLPVVPLYKMLRDKKHRKAALLLLSVCAWLYHIVDIPYYRQENNYLYYQYDMIKDWVEQDTDNEYAEDEKQDLRAATDIGDRMEQKLRHPANLERFARRLERFSARDELDGLCLATATQAHSLYLQYPNEGIFRNTPPRKQADPDGDYYDEIITMDKYISFTADTKGWLFDTLADTVNNEFNECGGTEEPILVKCFNGVPVTCSFDFERRAFEIMDGLCGILYNYKM